VRIDAARDDRKPRVTGKGDPDRVNVGVMKRFDTPRENAAGIHVAVSSENVRDGEPW
jgi:hypothetical protein